MGLVVRFALALAGLVIAFAPSRASANEICSDAAACFADDEHQSPPAPIAATADCDDDAFTKAVGTCDESGTTMDVAPTPVPTRAPLTCDGPSCRPQPAPLGAAGSHGDTFFQPVELLGGNLFLPEATTMMVWDESGGPRAGHCLRLERPPRR